MGTTYSVSYASTLFEFPVKEVSKKVHQALSDVDQRMSTYKADSELMRLNRFPVGEPFPASRDLVTLVLEAKKISVLSGGAYDVTVGPLVNLWGFGPASWAKKTGDTSDVDIDEVVNAPEFVQWMKESYPGSVPSRADITKARLNVGYQYLQADEAAQTITRLKPVFVDLNSIAKGYGVDQATSALVSMGVQNFMVEVGGEVMVHGRKPDGNLWRLAVRGPEFGNGQFSGIVSPGDKALATSGDYLNFFEINGKKYSHTINPATGWPEAKRIAEVAVIADSVAKADALATMFMVLGDQKGLALANREGIAARFAYYTNDGFETVTSQAFMPYLVK